MEFTDAQAIYQQVADHVCEMILKGEWAEEERIPAVRELAMDLQVNPNTVNKGYAHLQDRGIIYNQRGIGYFVRSGAADSTRALKREEFVEDELPRMFKTMKLIEMGIDDVAEEWNRYLTQNEGGDR